MTDRPPIQEAQLLPERAASPRLRLTRHIVLVGLMGSGKSAVGRRLANVVYAPFVDADEAIVEAAGMSIPDIFASHGEPEFRAVERRVIARLLTGEPQFIALGGGAFIDPTTRERIGECGFSIWLRAGLDTLVARTGKKKGVRPLLDAGDPRVVLAQLMSHRHPVYALADMTVDTGDQPLDMLVAELTNRLRQAKVLR